MTTQNDNKPASPTVCPAPRRGRFDQPEGAGLFLQHRRILARDERILAAHAASIALPVKPEEAHLVDESFRASGPGSIDQVFGTDWNQQEPRMTP
jgi:hypothetical protein